MPSKSPAQRRLMAAVAHNPKFAKKVGIPQSVGREFHAADQGRGYAGGGKVKSARELAEALSNWKANKLPQEGFFSTLDELIEQAPGDRAPVEQWLNYLKPGRKLLRGGVEFPLKKEELEYAKLTPEAFGSNAMPRVMAKAEIQRWARQARPDINQQVHSNNQLFEDAPGSADEVRRRGLRALRGLNEPYVEMAIYDSPGLYHKPSVPGSYEENTTVSPDIEAFNSHFNPQDISWSRTTQHKVPQVPTDPNSPSRGKLRLIEEIQSDRHSKAADKIFDPDPQNQAEWADIQRQMREAPGDYSRYATVSDWRGIPPDARDPLIIELRENLKKAQRRMGYRTPDDGAEIDRIDKRLKEIGVQRGRVIRMIPTDPEAFTEKDDGLLDEALTLSRHRAPLAAKPPDAPFKDPRDYSTLEIRKQLLNAVRDNDRYLGVTRGQDQIDRYEQGMDPQRSAGMRQMYDELYPSVLQKEAGRYGAKPIGDVEINAVGQRGKRPEEFTSDEWEQVEGFGDYMDRFDGGDLGAVDHAGALESTERLLREFREALEHEPYLMRGQASAELEKLEHKYTLANRQYQSGSYGDPEIMDEMPALWGQNGLMNGMHRWYDTHWQNIHDPQGKPDTKSFPSVELTPEVMDKIRKIGVPIFNFAGAAGVGSQLLNTDDPTDNEPSPGMAEGGAVAQTTTNPRKTLDYWKQVADSLPSGLPGGDSISPHVRRVLGSLASQVLTRDRGTGEMSLGMHPGVIDEVKALPTMGPMVYKALRHMSPAAGMPAMSDEQLDAQVPEWARTAERDTQDNAQAARVGMDVPEAHGFVQNLEEAGGQMLGQLPLPGAALQKLKRAKGLMGGAQRVGGSAMEYLGPTIEPTVSNYLKGTAFGGTMGAAGDKMGQMMDEKQQKEWIAQAMQEVLDEEQHKAANPPDHDAEDDEALAELGYADGGKVSAVKAVAAQLKTALQGVEDPTQRKAMIDRALAALKGVSIPTERRSALNTAALGLSDAAADTVPIRRQQRFGDYQSNILHLLENSDEQVQPISNIDPASVIAHVPQSYPVRRPPAQPEPGRGSMSQEDWQRMLDAGIPPDARVTYKADGGEVKQNLMYRPVAQTQKTPAQLAQAAAANATANPALSANVRGTELTADQYAHYGEGPEHNFFPDRTSGLPALPPGFTPVQNPVAQGGNGQQQGGGGSGSVLSGLGALGSLYKEATGRNPIKDIYQGGKDLYNNYFGTPQAEIDAEAAAKDTSQTNSQIDQDLQQMPNPANNPTYLGSAAAGAAGAGIGALGALTTPAGTVAITEGSQAIAALAAQAGGGAGAAGAAAASAGGAGGTGALGGGASADAAGAGSGALGVAGKAIPIAAAAYAAYGAYQAAAVGDKKGAVMNGAAAGAAIGSVVPVIGTAVGAVVGAVVGLVGASFGDQNKPSEAYYGSYKKQDPNATIRGWTQDQANGALFEAIKSHTKSGKAEAFEGSGELYKAFGISTNDYKGMQDQMADFIGGVIHTAQQSGGLPTDPAALAKMDGQQIFKQLVVPALSAKIGEATGQAQNAWSEGGDRSNIGTLENMFADYTDFMISGDNHAPVTIQSSGAAPKGGAKVQKKARGGLCSVFD